MIKLSCYDKNGEAIDYLYQWDTNIVLVLRGLSSKTPANLRFHFANQKRADAAVVEPRECTDGLMAVIPNDMFKQPEILYVYVYESDDDDEGRTIAEIRIPVRPRHKPSDYEEHEHPDDPSEVIIIYSSDTEAVSYGGIFENITDTIPPSEFECDDEYYFDYAVEATLDGNVRTKSNSLPAIGIIIYFLGGSYCNPIFLSSDPDAVKFRAGDSQENAAVSQPVYYNGVYWYYSVQEYGVSGNQIDSSSNMQKYPYEAEWDNYARSISGQAVLDILAYVHASKKED